MSGEEAGKAKSCEPKPRDRLNRAVWNVLGTFFVVLGAIGIALPVLPTTPFVLLAAACYAKGSERMHCWLMNNKYFGKYLRDYAEHRGMPMRAKIVSILFVWAGILFSAYFFVPVLWGQIAMVAVAIGVTVHLLKLKTLRS